MMLWPDRDAHLGSASGGLHSTVSPDYRKTFQN